MSPLFCCELVGRTAALLGDRTLTDALKGQYSAKIAEANILCTWLSDIFRQISLKYPKKGKYIQKCAYNAFGYHQTPLKQFRKSTNFILFPFHLNDTSVEQKINQLWCANQNAANKKGEGKS